MISVVFKLRYDNTPEMLVEISREFQVPCVPREGESVYWGTDKAGDWFGVERIWHRPNQGTVEVEFHCELWVLIEIWKSVDGWKITESCQGSSEKFFHYLEHPEELPED